MIAQRVRKHGAKARYQREEAGEGRLIGAMRSAQPKAAWEGFQSPQSTRAPADPPAPAAQVARDYSPDIGLKLLSGGEFNPSKAA